MLAWATRLDEIGASAGLERIGVDLDVEAVALIGSGEGRHVDTGILKSGRLDQKKRQVVSLAQLE